MKHPQITPRDEAAIRRMANSGFLNVDGIKCVPPDNDYVIARVLVAILDAKKQTRKTVINGFSDHA